MAPTPPRHLGSTRRPECDTRLQDGAHATINDTSLGVTLSETIQPQLPLETIQPQNVPHVDAVAVQDATTSVGKKCVFAEDRTLQGESMDDSSDKGSELSDALSSLAFSHSSWTKTTPSLPGILEGRLVQGSETHSIGSQTTDISNAVIQTQSVEVQASPTRSRAPVIPDNLRTPTNMTRIVINGAHIRKSKKRVLQSFTQTPKDTMAQLLREMALQINAQGKGCCSWHISLHAILNTVTGLIGAGCKTQWIPNSGWQCGACFTMRASDGDDERFCLCCLCDSTPVGIDISDTESEASSCEADDSTSSS